MTTEDRARVEQIVRFHELWAPDIEAWRERLAALRALIAAHDRLEQEREEAVAHDRQPYPTAAAYEAVCAALHRAEAEVTRLRAELPQCECETTHQPECIRALEQP